MRAKRLRVEPLEDRRMLATFTVTNLLDGAVNAAGDLPGSLRQAIFDANQSTGADDIVFSSPSGTLTLTNGELRITDELTITGLGSGQLTIDAQQLSRIFNIDRPGTTSETFASKITGMQLLNGRMAANNERGGAIRSGTLGSLTLEDCTIDGAYSHFGGGAVYSRRDLLLENCTITNSTTIAHNASGGGISSHGNVTVIDSLIEGNRAGGSAAGIDAGTTLIIQNSRILNNTAGISNPLVALGGGVSSTQVFVYDSTIAGNSVVSDDSKAGGIYALNAVTIVRSVVSENRTEGNSSEGGGIFLTTGTVIINDSWISGNATYGPNSIGGGIATQSSSSVSLYNSTVSGNYTLGNNAAGGGIYTGQLTAINSTISGNSTAGSNAGGGGVVGRGPMIVRHSTIVDNHTLGASSPGGGISHINSSLTIDHSILANNTSASGNPELRHILGTLSVNYSLVKDTTGSGITGTTGTGNLLGVDPRLNQLGFNQGLTPTHALRMDSPLINAGNASAVAGVGTVPQFDQRGNAFTRVADGRIDIGAYERSDVPEPGSLVVDLTEDILDPFDYHTSLREAIIYANATTGADTISFDVTVFATPQIIHLALGEMLITESVTVAGTGVDNLIVDASSSDPTPDSNNGDGSRIFRIDDGNMGNNSTVAISGMTLTGGDVTGSGGAIHSSENLILDDSTISDNFASGATSKGGAIFVSAIANLTVSDSSIIENSAVSGGGIYAGFADISNSVISDNQATTRGGGLYLIAPFEFTSQLINCSVEGNSSGLYGGGIHNSYGGLEIVNSTISGNVAKIGGGIVNDETAVLNITNSTVSTNTATLYGGGIAAYISTLNVDHCTITGNIGIAVNINNSGASISNSIISGNHLANNTPSNLQGVGITGDYNLLGSGATTSGTHNIISDNPMLGPLADNGGPTKTHRLLANSPALDAGDPSALAGVGGVPEFDQRGEGLGRVQSGRIDIGAYEVSAADFDFDGDVDGRDFLLWQRGFGKPNADRPDGDADDDNDVDAIDLDAWQDQYGLPDEVSPVAAFSADDGPGFLFMPQITSQAAVTEVVIDNEESTESVDYVFFELGTPTVSAVRDFGDIVVRRSVQNRFAADFQDGNFEDAI